MAIKGFTSIALIVAIAARGTCLAAGDLQADQTPSATEEPLSCIEVGVGPNWLGRLACLNQQLEIRAKHERTAVEKMDRIRDPAVLPPSDLGQFDTAAQQEHNAPRPSLAYKPPLLPVLKGP